MTGLPGRAEATPTVVIAVVAVTPMVATLTVVIVMTTIVAILSTLVMAMAIVIAADFHQRPGIDARRRVAAPRHQQHGRQCQASHDAAAT